MLLSRVGSLEQKVLRTMLYADLPGGGGRYHGGTAEVPGLYTLVTLAHEPRQSTKTPIGRFIRPIRHGWVCNLAFP